MVRLRLDKTDGDPDLQTDREHVLRRLRDLGLMPHVTPSLSIDVAYPVTAAAIQAGELDDDGSPTISLVLIGPFDAKQLPLKDLSLYASEVISAGFVDFPELKSSDARTSLLAFARKSNARPDRHGHFIAVDMARDSDHTGTLTLVATGPTESLLPALCELNNKLLASSQLVAALPRKRFTPPDAKSDQAELATV